MNWYLPKATKLHQETYHCEGGMNSVRHQCEKQLTSQKQSPMPESHHLESLILKVLGNQVTVWFPALPGHPTSRLLRIRLGLGVWTVSETSLEMGDKLCNSKC